MPVTIQEAVQRLEKELLPYSEKTRDKLSRTMVVRLNSMMDATAIESVGMQMKVMNNVKNRFVTCPGCIRRVIVPTVKFKGCPA